jgi:DNA-binding NtrC family response regulator
MAKVFLTGIDEAVERGLERALAMEKHKIEHRSGAAPIGDFLGADIVFAGGSGKQYLPLLLSLRQERPALPFIVVTRLPATSEWLDALEAGATDYCAPPIELRQINWIMESALQPGPKRYCVMAVQGTRAIAGKRFPAHCVLP